MNPTIMLIATLMSTSTAFAAQIIETIPVPFTTINEFTSIGNNLHMNANKNYNQGSHYIMDLDHQIDLLTLGGPGNNGPKNFFEINGHTYYENNDLTKGYLDVNNQLWVTDGTPEGTIKCVDSPLGEITPLGNMILFRRYTPEHGYELWGYQDGASQAEMILDINPGSESSYPENMCVYQNKLYFFAYSPLYGYELWVSDGTPSGTTLFKDCNPGSDNGQIANFTTYKDHEHPQLVNKYKPAVYNNILYFFATNGINGYELWSTDGTPEQTQMIKDINIGPGHSLYPRLNDQGIGNGPLFTQFATGLFFVVDDGIHGFELWRTINQGTDAVLLMDINIGPADSRINEIIEYNKYLYFPADDGIHGLELWRTHGIPQLTHLFIDILNHPLCPQNCANVNNLVVYDSTLYFAATGARDTTRCKFGFCEPWYKLNDYLYSTDGMLENTQAIAMISHSTAWKNHFITAHVDGIYMLNYSSSSDFELVHLYESSPPEFESTPVIAGKIGETYQYEIITSSSLDKPATLTIGVKPDWLTFSVDEISGIGLLEGVPNVVGDFQVEITATNIFDQYTVQSFTISVTNDPPIFESTPVISGNIGEIYQYEIITSSPLDEPATLTVGVKPDWLTFSVDEVSGIGLLEGMPNDAGDFQVEITATNIFNQYTIQSFTISVTNNLLIDIRAVMRDEGLHESQISKPRIYIVNEGTSTISDFIVEYYFSSEHGKIPILEDYYTPMSRVDLVDMGDGNYKIVYDFNGTSLLPGQLNPGIDGNVVGLHYSDWSFFDKTNDHSNNLKQTFSENNNICIYSSNRTLLWGNPK